MRHPILTLAAVAVLAAACGGQNDQASVTTTNHPAVTSSTTSTTTAPACDTAPDPAGGISQSTSDADVDGDGRADEVRLFLVGDSEWHLHVTLAATGTADVTLTVLGSESVAVLGGADVDGDGADEIWASIGAGASATIIGLARFADCALTQVTFAGGRPAEFPIGGSVGTASGLECVTDDPSGVDVIAYTASNTRDDRYEVKGTDFTLEGDVLVRQSTHTTSVSNNDPAFQRATGFACGSVAL